MFRKLISILAIMMFITGIAFFSYPWMQKWIGEKQQQEEIIKFKKQKSELAKQTLDKLKSDMQNYNLNIYENHQNDLQDAWSYEQEVFSLEAYGIDNSIIGTLEIEAMDVRLPLYLGASQEHLSKGATVLGQTSMPIGGKNTNCVVAAHRGYRGESMFRDIEDLKKGDIIRLTNPWETMTYKVYDIAVITPDNIEAIKIFENQDMLTLITCHPYTKNYQRYVVYCIREDNYDNQQINEELENRKQDIDYELSSSNILNEKYLSIVTIVFLFICLILMIFIKIYKKSKK